VASPDFLWPVPGHYAVSSGFLDQRGYGQHNAIDIPAPIGTAAVAAARGHVAFAGAAGDCGLAVFIDHPDGWRTHYCHHNFLRVTSGQDVAQGQRIADVGATGAALGPHLHFNLFALAPPNVGPSAYVAWVGKYAVDPLRYLGKEDPDVKYWLIQSLTGDKVSVYVTDGIHKRRANMMVGTLAALGALHNPDQAQRIAERFIDWLLPFPKGEE